MAAYIGNERYGLSDPAKRASSQLKDAIEEAESVDVIAHDTTFGSWSERRAAAIEERRAREKSLIAPHEALREPPVLAAHTPPRETRIAIFTAHPDALVHDSPRQRKYWEFGRMFAEVHVIVLCLRGASVNEPARMGTNVWLYPTNSRTWWRQGFDAYRIARQQLAFSSGFRADILIAEDPFEAGMAAYGVAKKYERAFQVHLSEDYFDPSFKTRDSHNSLRLSLARYVLRRARSVRTTSIGLKEKIIGTYPWLKDDLEVLPTYYDLALWRDALPADDMRARYPQFTFIMLHVTTMTEPSRTREVFDGLHAVLKRYPTSGLIIIGDGPQREYLRTRAEALGIGKQVVFAGSDIDVVSSLKSAHALVHLSAVPDEEHVVLKAAAIGVPMVLGDGGLGAKLFSDGEEAFLCPTDSPPCVREKIGKLMSDGSLRMRFVREARDTVFGRIEQDYGQYTKAYQNSIERSMIEEG